MFSAVRAISGKHCRLLCFLVLAILLGSCGSDGGFEANNDRLSTVSGFSQLLSFRTTNGESRQIAAPEGEEEISRLWPAESSSTAVALQSTSATLSTPEFRRFLDLSFTTSIDVSSVPRVYPRTDAFLGWRQRLSAIPNGTAAEPATTIYRSHYHPPSGRPDLQLTPFDTWLTVEVTVVNSGSSAVATTRSYDLNNPNGRVTNIQNFSSALSLFEFTGFIALGPLSASNFPNGNWDFSAETFLESEPANTFGPVSVYVRELGLSDIAVNPDPFTPDGTATQSISTQALIETAESSIPSQLQPENLRYTYTVTISNLEGTVLRTFEQASPSSLEDGRLSIEWDGTDSSGALLQAGPHMIRVNMIASDEKTEVQRDGTLTIGSKKVRVQNLQANPETFEPENDETITLSFDLVADGFDAPQLEWSVKVTQDEQLFTEFPLASPENPGPFTVRDFTGDRVTVELEWDGKEGENVIEGPFNWEVRGTACDGVAPATVNMRSYPVRFQQSCDFDDAVLVAQAGNLPTLKALDASSNVERPVGISSGSRQRLLEKFVFLYNRINPIDPVKRVLTLRAENLRFSGDPNDPPDEVWVTLESVVSGVTTDPVKLDLDPNTRTYEMDYTLDDTFIRIGGLGTQTTYSVVEGLLIGAGAQFKKEIIDKATPGDPLAPGPHQSLGTMKEQLWDSDQDAAEDEVRTEVDNLISTGFEAVRVRLEPDEDLNPRLQDSLEVVVKVRHPADVMYVTLHGTHIGQLLLTRDAARLFPNVPIVTFNATDLLATDTQSLRALIFAACDVLDLNDYNNVFSLPDPQRNRPPEHAIDDPIAVRRTITGGRGWDRVCGNGRTALVGYNAYAPISGIDPTLERFREELNRLGNIQLAWLAANARVSLTGGNNVLSLNACAYDQQGYYYIPYDLPQTRYTPDPATAKGVYLVPRGRFETDPDDWAAVPPSVADPVNVTIPGFPPR